MKETQVNSVEFTFLKKLFISLNDAEVRYAVLRNYSSLPDSVEGSDLDLWVHPVDKLSFFAHLSSSLKTVKGVNLGCYESGSFYKATLIGSSSSNTDEWWGLCLDVNFGLYYCGASYADNEQLLGSVFKHNGIVDVIEPGLAGVFGLLKELLNNSQLDERYVIDAEGVLLDHPECVRKILGMSDSTVVDILTALVSGSKSKVVVTKQASLLRRRIYRQSFQRNPIGFPVHSINSRLSKFWRFQKPSGHFLAIHGVDGVGKSTVINALSPVLKAATHGCHEIFHLRPTWLPPLSRLKGKTSSPLDQSLDPHGSEPSGFLGSLFRLFYLWMDYTIGYWIRIRPKLGKSPTVIIFDRYAYDLVVDPRRFRIAVPKWLRRLVVATVPQPDLSICLHAPVEVILNRKQELPRSELNRQLSELNAYAQKNPSALLISTEGSVLVVRNHVLNAMMERLGRS